MRVANGLKKHWRLSNRPGHRTPVHSRANIFAFLRPRWLRSRCKNRIRHCVLRPIARKPRPLLVNVGMRSLSHRQSIPSQNCQTTWKATVKRFAPRGTTPRSQMWRFFFRYMSKRPTAQVRGTVEPSIMHYFHTVSHQAKLGQRDQSASYAYLREVRQRMGSVTWEEIDQTMGIYGTPETCVAKAARGPRSVWNGSGCLLVQSRRAHSPPTGACEYEAICNGSDACGAGTLMGMNG